MSKRWENVINRGYKKVQQLADRFIFQSQVLGDEALYEIHDYWETQRPHASVRTAVGETHFDQVLQQQSVQPYSPEAIGLENIWGQPLQRGGIPQAPVATSTENMYGSMTGT